MRVRQRKNEIRDTGRAPPERHDARVALADLPQAPPSHALQTLVCAYVRPLDDRERDMMRFETCQDQQGVRQLWLRADARYEASGLDSADTFTTAGTLFAPRIFISVKHHDSLCSVMAISARKTRKRGEINSHDCFDLPGLA
ncbi:hypothetical protein CCMA1212_002260 [Trichoderma ghanense]|uniref:Uncharacterized protein n=1 Tax=Trichoderma ghanense TaxID=65468 RepID=A0ABY2HBQ6_9HYPO